ncbi:MAG: TolC family protein [Bacteroidota bacterium]
MKRWNIIASMALTLIFSGAKAQDTTYTLSLNDAIQYALKHNKTLLNQRDNLLVAEEKIKETRSQGLPQINGTVDFMTYFNYELEFNFGGGGTTAPPDINYSLLDAGDVEVISVITEMLAPAEPQPIVMDNQSNANLQVTQLLFSGQYWAGLQTSKIAKKLSNQNIVKTELDTKQSIISTYYNILLLEQNIGFLKEFVKNLEETVYHTNNMHKAGVVEQADVDQLRMSLNEQKNTLTSTERMLKLNYNMLKFQMGVEPGTSIALTDSLELFLDLTGNKEVSPQDSALKNNIDYQMMETQVELSKKQVELQKWAYAPTLSGFYNYTEKIMTTGFDLSPNHSAGFNLSVPIFTGGMRKSQINQAKINLDITKRNKDMVSEQLQMQEKQLRFELQNAMDNYNTQKENMEMAERVYESRLNKYMQGVFSSLDLTQANTNYVSARNNYFSAAITLLQARLALDKLYNSL